MGRRWVVYAFGYRFPAYRGGPMYYADSIGLGRNVSTISEFGDTCGEQFWEPTFLLKHLFIEGKS
jgi:3-hydroxyacyl-CoA dehydrogenase